MTSHSNSSGFVLKYFKHMLKRNGFHNSESIMGVPDYMTSGAEQAAGAREIKFPYDSP